MTRVTRMEKTWVCPAIHAIRGHHSGCGPAPVRTGCGVRRNVKKVEKALHRLGVSIVMKVGGERRRQATARDGGAGRRRGMTGADGPDAGAGRARFSCPGRVSGRETRQTRQAAPAAACSAQTVLIEGEEWGRCATRFAWAGSASERSRHG